LAGAERPAPIELHPNLPPNSLPGAIRPVPPSVSLQHQVLPGTRSSPLLKSPWILIYARHHTMHGLFSGPVIRAKKEPGLFAGQAFKTIKCKY